MKLRLESAGIEASPDVKRQLDAADDEVDRLAPIVDRLLVPRARWRREAPARPTWPTRRSGGGALAPSGAGGADDPSSDGSGPGSGGGSDDPRATTTARTTTDPRSAEIGRRP